ncbi:hypothetical protein T265_03845 [Opisthorchis viverrini]|uniref:Prefoldin subunit 3 n=1 Tax=Opisthorchis viverrini TaxID=6198 RepID=A0A074ZQZ4_OPIVI|nr:hypothetical protein T265_03845 [Opisthorchis viverrini]KER29546.1 hypothetical protein T265_03845 [Opisthorchis viverrini]
MCPEPGTAVTIPRIAHTEPSFIEESCFSCPLQSDVSREMEEMGLIGKSLSTFGAARLPGWGPRETLYYPQMSDNTTAVTTGHTGDSESISERKGIPKAVFMEDVDAYMKANNFSTLMEAGRSFEELYQKYKLIEQALLQRKLRLMQQLPDIQKTLAVVHQLQKKDSDLDVTFEVSSQLFARAHIPKADRVGLWLGANVMLEYDLEEADKILVENEQSAKQSLQDVDQTLEFLKEQTTTVEVNLARIHNLSVKRGRLNKAGAVST